MLRLWNGSRILERDSSAMSKFIIGEIAAKVLNLKCQKTNIKLLPQ